MVYTEEWGTQGWLKAPCARGRLTSGHALCGVIGQVWAAPHWAPPSLGVCRPLLWDWPFSPERTPPLSCAEGELSQAATVFRAEWEEGLGASLSLS